MFVPLSLIDELPSVDVPTNLVAYPAVPVPPTVLPESATAPASKQLFPLASQYSFAAIPPATSKSTDTALGFAPIPTTDPVSQIFESTS